MDEKNIDYVIRLASQTDAMEIARNLTILGHQTTGEDINARWEKWTSDGNVCFVAQKSDGTLGGIATIHQMRVLHRPRPVGRITALVVEDALRGKGVGHALVKFAESSLTMSGCGLLEITSNVLRNQAHEFYEHIGYERTSVRFAKKLAK